MQEASRRLRYIDEAEEEDTIAVALPPATPAEPQPAGPRLEVRGPSGGLIQTVPLSGQVFTIGRGSDQDVRIIDHTVSRHHAEIRCEGESFFVRDVGSVNGTMLNGEPLEGEKELHHGDIIGVGKHSLVFIVDK
jgi:pSer/pThr/pTyr-binding forkhead associated (FHA) protein